MSELVQEPQFLLFGKTPRDLLARPPLASSLQNFESCLLLLTLDRYPHAFTTCAFAIESALRAEFGVPADDKRYDLRKLMNRVSGIKPADRDLPNTRQFSSRIRNDLPRTRDRIVHYGFSPKDDALTATLLLESAIPYLAAVYDDFFQFDLYDGLVDCGEQLQNALLAFEHAKARPELSVWLKPKHCFVVLVHMLRDQLKHNFVTQWEIDAAEDAEYHPKYDHIERQRPWVERELGCAWSFDCPLCGELESLVCELVEKELDVKQISLARCYCLACGLLVPKGIPFLTNALCRDQVEEKYETILREFGIS
jgi:hypothetical protein